MKIWADYQAEEALLRRWKIHHRRLLRTDVEAIAKALYRQRGQIVNVTCDYLPERSQVRVVVEWRNRDYQTPHELANITGRSWMDAAMKLEKLIAEQEVIRSSIW